MPSDTEIAELVVDRCPNCGSTNFRITRAKPTLVRCGFMWMNQEWIFRVFYRCAECGGKQLGRASLESGPYVDVDIPTVQMAIDAKRAHQKKFRDLLGLE